MNTITINEWHSVTDVMPWEGRPCLVQTDTGLLFIAVYKDGHWVEVNTRTQNAISGIKVTHFMVFQKPPKWHDELQRFAMYTEQWARAIAKKGYIVKVTDPYGDELFFSTTTMASRHTGDSLGIVSKARYGAIRSKTNHTYEIIKTNENI